MTTIEELQKALEERPSLKDGESLEDYYQRVLNWFADFVGLFFAFEKANVIVPRKQLSELDTTQWLIEHEAEIQNHFQRPIIQLSRAQILGYFIHKELLEGSK